MYYQLSYPKTTGELPAVEKIESSSSGTSRVSRWYKLVKHKDWVNSTCLSYADSPADHKVKQLRMAESWQYSRVIGVGLLDVGFSPDGSFAGEDGQFMTPCDTMEKRLSLTIPFLQCSSVVASVYRRTLCRRQGSQFRDSNFSVSRTCPVAVNVAQV